VALRPRTAQVEGEEGEKRTARLTLSMLLMMLVTGGVVQAATFLANSRFDHGTRIRATGSAKTRSRPFPLGKSFGPS
jgi:hypothetical protein